MSGPIVTPENGPAGRDKAYCGGRKRDGSGDTCTRPAGWGTDHPGIGRCKLHGGKTGSHRAAAQREIARQAVATFGLPIEIDPHQAVLGEVYRTAGAVAWLDDIVRNLPPADVVWGVTEETTKDSGEFPGVDVTRKAAPNVWVDLWQRERKHLVAVCKAAADMKIDERMVRLAEAQGAQLAGVIRELVARLGLSAEQAALVPDALQQAVAAVVGGPVIDGEAA